MSSEARFGFEFKKVQSFLFEFEFEVNKLLEFKFNALLFPMGQRTKKPGRVKQMPIQNFSVMQRVIMCCAHNNNKFEQNFFKIAIE